MSDLRVGDIVRFDERIRKHVQYADPIFVVKAISDGGKTHDGETVYEVDILNGDQASFSKIYYRRHLELVPPLTPVFL